MSPKKAVDGEKEIFIILAASEFFLLWHVRSDCEDRGTSYEPVGMDICEACVHFSPPGLDYTVFIDFPLHGSPAGSTQVPTCLP